MEQLRAILEQLTDVELDYVFERSKVTSNKQALGAAGIPESTFYSWPKEKQDGLNEYAQALKRNRLLAAELVLVENAEQAARVITGQLASDSESIAQRAAQDVLDRTAGKPQQKMDVTSGGKSIFDLDEWKRARQERLAEAQEIEGEQDV